MMDSSVEPVLVLSALEEQVGCYRSLAKLAERQHEYVQNEQTEELLEVLGERQGVLEEVGRLEMAVGSAKKAWGEFVGGLSEEDRARAEGMLGETKRLLAEITAGDERDALVLQQRKHRIGTEIRATTTSRTVNRSYAASAYGRPRIINVDETR